MSQKTHKDNVAVTLIVSVLVFGALFAFWGVKKIMIARYMSHFSPPPVAVSATKATMQSWQPKVFAVGTLVAKQGVDITPQVAGIINNIYFKSGEEVHAGQLLVSLDMQVEQAGLENFQAGLNLAKIDYKRLQKLYLEKGTSKSSLDTAFAKLEQAKAEVDKTKATINYKNIRAPFSGRLGIREIDRGQYVQPGNKLVTLQSLDSLYVDAQLPEHYFAKVHKGQDVIVTSDVVKGYQFKGKVIAVNAKVSNDTRTLQIRAQIDNNAHRLLPGMFANVDILEPVQNSIVTVPRTAITYTLYGDSVYVVEHKGKDKLGKPLLKVMRTYVKPGEVRGNEVQILSGLKAGQEVVTSGQLKLNNGARIVISKIKS